MLEKNAIALHCITSQRIIKHRKIYAIQKYDATQNTIQKYFSENRHENHVRDSFNKQN